MSDTRQRVHELVDRLSAHALSEVARWLESRLRDEQEECAVAEAKEWVRQNPGKNIPHENVLADFGRLRFFKEWPNSAPMAKRIEWTPVAREDIRRIDRTIALGLLEGLADYVINGHGDVDRLAHMNPPELRLRIREYVFASMIIRTGIEILRVLHRREAYR